MDNIFTDNNSYLSDAKDNSDALKIDKLWYTFPIGDEFKITVGPLIENYYMVETPTRYKPVLKAFKLGGYGALMGAQSGGGAGIQWRQNVPRGEAALNIAANYTTDDGEAASSDSTKGMFGSASDGYFLSQIGYGNREWYVAAMYAHKHGDGGSNPTVGYSTDLAGDTEDALNAYGLRGYWTPQESGIIPSISAGVDFASADAKTTGKATDLFGWMVGLNWDDAFIEGNKLGAAFGSYSSYATAKKGDSSPDDENFAAEVYYAFRVTDHITIKPALFWVTDADGANAIKGEDTMGALVQTTFKF